MRIKSMRGHSSRQGRRKAFTFLEIMFVVVIIGVLAGIVATSSVGRGHKARMEATRLQMVHIDSALAQFEMHLGRFPDTREGLQALLTRPSSISEQTWDGPYLKADGGELPRDGWRNPFGYRSPGEHGGHYDLWSPGPDGREGTDDDITNWSRAEGGR